MLRGRDERGRSRKGSRARNQWLAVAVEGRKEDRSIDKEVQSAMLRYSTATRPASTRKIARSHIPLPLQYHYQIRDGVASPSSGFLGSHRLLNRFLPLSGCLACLLLCRFLPRFRHLNIAVRFLRLSRLIVCCVLRCEGHVLMCPLWLRLLLAIDMAIK